MVRLKDCGLRIAGKLTPTPPLNPAQLSDTRPLCLSVQLGGVSVSGAD